MGLKSFVKDLYDFDFKSIVSINPSTFQGFDLIGSKHAGVKVNTDTAIAHDTVFACVRDKAESIGQLPVCLYRKEGARNNKVHSGREHRIFTLKPNPYQTMQDMIEMYVATIELRGNWFAYVVRNRYNNIAEILPFRFQSNVSVNMDAHGQVYYTYSTNDGKPTIAFSNREIIHVKNFTLDGFTGLSAISYGARAIGLAISQEEYLSKLMEKGALQRGILTTDQLFKDKAAIDRLREQWDAFSGIKGMGKTPILEQNLKYQPLTLSPADTELIAQRGFSREQICGLLRVPPHRVGVTANQKSKDTEQDNKDYYQNKLVPLITKFENAINYVLPDNLNIKLDEKGFIRGDFKSSVEAAHEVVKSGLGSINEGREIIGFQPIDGGEVHAIDTNNLTFGLVTDIPKLQEEQRLLAQSNANANNNDDEDDDDDDEA